jgi:hypothetical protein
MILKKTGIRHTEIEFTGGSTTLILRRPRSMDLVVHLVAFLISRFLSQVPDYQ